MSFDRTNITDEAYLVNCCKNNEPSAQKALYNIYVKDMMVLCLRYIANNEDAKEVLMDAFLSFFRNIGSFTYQGVGSVKAWLKKIVVNQCLMHLRKQHPAFDTNTDITGYVDKEVDDDTFGQLAVKEILKLVRELPDGYRMVFNLYVFEGMNHREIGEALEISENTSKSQLHRARAILKEKIEELG